MTRYPSLAEHWKDRFGERVQRVPLDAGLSCPNRDGTAGREGCAFCDPGSFSPAHADGRPIRTQLADAIGRLSAAGRARKFAAYFQPGTNTYAPLEVLRRLWDEAAAASTEVVALCVGTRPDCAPEPVLDLLASYLGRFGRSGSSSASSRRTTRPSTGSGGGTAQRRSAWPAGGRGRGASRSAPT
jgi:radical SAM protein (TIGR01212 family)